MIRLREKRWRQKKWGGRQREREREIGQARIERVSSYEGHLTNSTDISPSIIEDWEIENYNEFQFNILYNLKNKLYFIFEMCLLYSYNKLKQFFFFLLPKIINLIWQDTYFSSATFWLSLIYASITDGIILSMIAFNL